MILFLITKLIYVEKISVWGGLMGGINPRRGCIPKIVEQANTQGDCCKLQVTTA